VTLFRRIVLHRIAALSVLGFVQKGLLCTSAGCTGTTVNIYLRHITQAPAARRYNDTVRMRYDVTKVFTLPMLRALHNYSYEARLKYLELQSLELRRLV